MKRRDFLKLLSSVGIWSAAPLPLSQALATTYSPYEGPIYFNIHVRGGLDQSSFTDPREDPLINSWANTADAGVAGNIRYAPLSDNQEFFEKYYQHMLVFNGVLGESNGHATATISRWSGRLASGYPTTAELIAAAYGQGLPLAYVSRGGYEYSAGLIPFTRVPTPTMIREIAKPNRKNVSANFVRQTELNVLQQYKQARLDALRSRDTNLPTFNRALNELNIAYQGRGLLERLADYIPSTGIDTVDTKGYTTAIVQNMHLALISAQAGLTVCANLGTDFGFDHHSDFDKLSASSLPRLTGAIDYLWEKAEELGLADRLVVYITTDVGRTPHYNSNGGKDHLQIASGMFMKKNAPWGNRVVGASAEHHQALAINPQTLELDENGIILRPKHILQAYRKLAGIDQLSFVQDFELDAEEVDIFNPSKSTNYAVNFRS